MLQPTLKNLFFRFCLKGSPIWGGRTYCALRVFAHVQSIRHLKMTFQNFKILKSHFIKAISHTCPAHPPGTGPDQLVRLFA
jgi:hypothetical protein